MTHYIDLKGLKPDTLYYFKINTDGSQKPENSYLSFKTPTVLSGHLDWQNFSGTVTQKGTSEPPEEGIVFLSSDKGQLLSAPVNAAGSWQISFFGLREAGLTQYFNLSGTDQVKFMTYTDDGFGLLGPYASKKTDIHIEAEKQVSNSSTNDESGFFKMSLGF